MDLTCPECGAHLEFTLQAVTARPTLPELVQPPSPSGPQLISVAEAAARLAISRAKVHQEMTSGRLPSVKIGGRRLVALRKLEEFIEESAEPTSTPRLSPLWNDLAGVVARARIPARPRPAARRSPASPTPVAASPPPRTTPRPWTEWMAPEEHEAALQRMAANGYPEDVLQHMRDEPLGLYTIGLPEAARRLGLANSTVYKLVRDGRLPTFTYQPYASERPKQLIGLRALERWIETEGAKEPGPGRPRRRKTTVKEVKPPKVV